MDKNNQEKERAELEDVKRRLSGVERRTKHLEEQVDVIRRGK